MLEENTLTSPDQALAFINRYGLVTLFPVKGKQFPSLYRAIQGSLEEKLERTWTWGDELAQAKRIHYGKLVHAQVTLVSLEMFPYLLRVARERQLSATARRMLDHLRQHGQTSTTRLREALDLAGKAQKGEFSRALDELQAAFAIAIVAREKAPKFTYSYDLMERWMPKALLAKADSTAAETAKERIVAKLLETSVIAAPQDMKQFLRI
jgi:uncharacterized protein YcaQ